MSAIVSLNERCGGGGGCGGDVDAIESLDERCGGGGGGDVDDNNSNISSNDNDDNMYYVTRVTVMSCA